MQVPRYLPLVLLSSLAAAQSGGTVVSKIGDVLPGGVGTIDQFWHIDVDSAGRWIAAVDVDGMPNASHDEAVIAWDGSSIVEGSPFLGTPNTEVRGIDGVSMDDAGNCYAQVDVDFDLTSNDPVLTVVVRNFTDIVLSEATLLPGSPSWSVGSTLRTFSWARFNDNGEVLVVGDIIDPGASGTPNVVLRGTYSGGELTSAEVLAYEDTFLDGQSEMFAFGQSLTDINGISDNFDSIWFGDMAGSSSLDGGLFLNHTLIAQEGSPSPVAGRNWDSGFLPGVDINATGSYAFVEELDGDFATDGLLVKDGLKYVQDGDGLASFPNTVIASMGQSVSINDAGQLLYHVNLNGTDVNNSGDEILMLDDRILVREGSSFVDGIEIDTVRHNRNEYVMSQEGNWFLYLAILDGDAEDSLVLMPKPLGTLYCGPATKNSSENYGRINAIGSNAVSDNDLTLEATGLAENQFAMFVNSQTQGSATPPGSQGTLCLGGAIGRHRANILHTGFGGAVSLTLDLNAIPTPSGPVAIQPGETWNWQLWFRDVNPTQTSNFTDGISITFE